MMIKKLIFWTASIISDHVVSPLPAAMFLCVYGKDLRDFRNLVGLYHTHIKTFPLASGVFSHVWLLRRYFILRASLTSTLDRVLLS